MTFSEERKKMIEQLKANDPMIHFRRSGRSTGQAMRGLGLAMLNPGQSFPVRDHHGTTQANKHLISIMQNIVTILRLEGFEFDMTSQQVRFRVP